MQKYQYTIFIPKWQNLEENEKLFIITYILDKLDSNYLDVIREYNGFKIQSFKNIDLLQLQKELMDKFNIEISIYRMFTE